MPSGIANLRTINDRSVRQPEQIRELVIPGGMMLIRSIAPTCVLPDRVTGPKVSKGKSALAVDLAAANLIALLIQLAVLDRRVITVTPNFALYGLDAELLGASLTEVPMRPGLSMDVSSLVEAIKGEPTSTAQTGGVV